MTAFEFLKRLWSYHVVKQVTWFSAYLIKPGIALLKTAILYEYFALSVVFGLHFYRF